MIGGSTGIPGTAAAASRVLYDPATWVGLVGVLGAVTPGFGGIDAVLEPIVGPSSIAYGTDGRLTILVVGSDYRYRKPNHGERLDTVIVATINPKTRQMAVVSIPRDVGNLPLPDATDTFHGKVNSLFAHYRRLVGTRDAALEKMREAIAHALRVEIDYVAFTRFEGFDLLVDEIGGVYTDIPASIYDSRIVDDRTRPRGAKFVAGSNVLLDGDDARKCHATPKPINWGRVPACKRALMYVRSRHGQVGTRYNSDYKRARRQQEFLMAALRRVAGRGKGAALTSLRDAALSRPRDVYTTLPIATPADLMSLFDLFNGAQDQPFLQAVLKPNKYAYRVVGTRRYELRLDVVRALTAEWFGPVR